LRPRSRIGIGDSSLAPTTICPIMKEQAMKNDRPEANAELNSFEPLRITFAVLALLLGLIAALHV